MKLLIVDDHPIVREGAAAAFSELNWGQDTAVLQAGETRPEGALALCEPNTPDLDVASILDLGLPGAGRLEGAIAEFGRCPPELPGDCALGLGGRTAEGACAPRSAPGRPRKLCAQIREPACTSVRHTAGVPERRDLRAARAQSWATRRPP